MSEAGPVYASWAAALKPLPAESSRCVRASPASGRFPGQGEQRVGYGVHHRWQGADRAGFSRSLNPEGIGGRRNHVEAGLEIAQVASARQAVIHERSGQELARLGIVGDLLHERLADALGEAAVNLPFQEQRIENRSEIVDHDVTQKYRRSGFRIDFHLGDMAAVGEVDRAGTKRGDFVEAGFQVLRQKRGVVGCRGHGGNIHRPVGSGDGEDAVFERDVVFGGLQHVGRYSRTLGDYLVRRARHRRPCESGRPRGEGSSAEADHVSIACDVTHAFRGDPEAAAKDLGKGGGMTLPMVDRAGDQRNGPGLIKTDLRRFDLRAGGAVHGVGNAYSPQLAAGARLPPPLFETGIASKRHGVVHVPFEGSAVVGEGQRRAIGHGVFGDRVAAAQLCRVGFESPRGLIDQPLQNGGRFRSSCAAIGSGAVGIREDARDPHMDGGNRIDACEGTQIDDRRQRAAQRQIGSEIGEGRAAEREKVALRVEREGCVGYVVAR